MSARRATAVALALLAACSQQPQKAQPPSPFQQFAAGLVGEPPCSREIPMHWSPSLPVPVLVDQRLHYRVFFRGWEGRPDTGIVIHDAEGDALFSADGKVLECRQRSKTGRTIPDERLITTTREEFDARMRTLYGSIEEIGQRYARDTPVPEAERARVLVFSREFSALTGSGHAAAYRALSPGFWAWVEKNGGIGPMPAK